MIRSYQKNLCFKLPQNNKGGGVNAITAPAVPLPTFCEQLLLLLSATEALPCIELSSEHLHFLYHFLLKSQRKKINNGTNILFFLSTKCAAHDKACRLSYDKSSSKNKAKNVL